MRSCPVPPLMRRPIRSRVPVAILFTSTLSRMGMRSESPCALGVIVTEPITRSARKSDLTTTCTESFCVVSTSKASMSTGSPPWRAVVSSGNTRNTESTSVMLSLVPVPFGTNDVGRTSNRTTPRVSSVSGRLASNRAGDSPNSG